MDEPASTQPAEQHPGGSATPPAKAKWTWKRAAGLLLLVAGFAVLIWGIVQACEAVMWVHRNFPSRLSVVTSYLVHGYESSTSKTSAPTTSTHMTVGIPWFVGCWALVVAGLWLAKLGRRWPVVVLAAVLTLATIGLPYMLLPLLAARGRISLTVTHEPELCPALEPADVEALRKALEPKAVLAALPPGELVERLNLRAAGNVRTVDVEAVSVSDKEPRTGARCKVEFGTPLDDPRCKALTAFCQCYFQLVVTERFKHRAPDIRRILWDAPVAAWLEPWLKEQEKLRQEKPGAKEAPPPAGR